VSVPNTAQSSEQRPEHAFDESAYTFMTFLYAAAVHLVIAKAYESNALRRASDVLLLCLVLFLFSDWASRARLPRLLPENPAGYLYVVKICLEIICIFFLVSSFLLVVGGTPERSTTEDAGLSATLAFGWFLLATACWDYLMIYIMKKLDVISLSRSVWITGRALDMEEARKEYLAKFDKWKQRRRSEIFAAREETKRKLNDDPDHFVAHNFTAFACGCRDLCHTSVFEGTVASVAQLLANHVLQANLVAGMALILNAVWLKGSPLDFIVGSQSPLYDAIHLRLAFYALSIGAALLVCALCLPKQRWLFGIALAALILVAEFGSSPVVPTALKLGAIVSAIFLISTSFYAFRNSGMGVLANRLGGWTIVFSLVVLYLMLPAPLLIALLAAQQVLANAFLQFGVSTERRLAPTVSVAPANPPTAWTANPPVGSN